MNKASDNNKADQEYVYGEDSIMTLKMHSSRTAETHARWFLPYLKPGMKLLDCGCGSGSITVGLAKLIEPGQVTGVDISALEIERAKDRAVKNKITNIHFEVADIYQLDFTDNSFDAIFSHNVLEHIADPSRVLREMHRVLKSGGVIGIRDIDLGGNLSAPENELFDKALVIWGGVIRNTGGNPQLGRHLGRLLHEAGFVVVKMSASYEVYGDPKSYKNYSQIIADRFAEPDFIEQVTGCGLATIEEMVAIRKAILDSQMLPGAFTAVSHCEAIGWKAT